MSAKRRSGGGGTFDSNSTPLGVRKGAGGVEERRHESKGGREVLQKYSAAGASSGLDGDVDNAMLPPEDMDLDVEVEEDAEVPWGIDVQVSVCASA